MFPLLPVILMLLLQGPSSDRLLRNGNWCGKVDAVSTELGWSECDRVVLASLLAQEDSRLSDALLAIIHAPRIEATAPACGPTEAIEFAEPRRSVPEGFEKGSRVRDGPHSVNP